MIKSVPVCYENIGEQMKNMDDAKANKLQYLLITQLLEEGSVQLLLPDGVKLDIGIIQEDGHGRRKKVDDYCYVIAERDGNKATLDSYNVGLEYESSDEKIIYEDESTNGQGRLVKTLEVI